MSKIEIVGLIPVKSSSERVVSKNLRDFGGVSLYELKLQQLALTTGFADLIVSSEDEKILAIAKKHGFSIHKRDPKYSTSHIPMSEVYSYIASEINGENIAWINVTNPLAGPECYDRAVQIYEMMDGNYDCLLSVTKLQSYLFHHGMPLNFAPNPWPKSQDLSGLLEMSFVINILKRLDMVRWGSCVGNHPYFYQLERLESWDIDDQEDFDFCEMIFKNKW